MYSLILAAVLGSTLPILGSTSPFLDRAPFAPIEQRAGVNPDAKAMADFSQRVEQYAALHKKIEDALPKLSKESTPDEIDKNQRAFAALIAEARKNAKVGDVFTPPMQAVARQLMARVFNNADSRRQLRDSVMDENPAAGQVKLAVNGRYPDEVPLSTMPPDILKGLPPLPEELEYRFIGETLILLDPHSHIIVDYVTRALPR